MTNEAPPPSGGAGGPPGANRRRRRRRGGRGGRGPGSGALETGAAGDEGAEGDDGDEPQAAGANAGENPPPQTTQQPQSPAQPPQQRRDERAPGAAQPPRAQAPRGDQRGQQPRPQRQRSGRPDQPRSAPRNDQQRADQPRDQQRADQPRDQQRADQPRDQQRADQPRDQQRADQPRDQQRADQPRRDRPGERSRSDRPDQPQRRDQQRSDARPRDQQRPDPRSQNRAPDRGRGGARPPGNANAAPPAASPSRQPAGAPQSANDLEAPLARPSAEIDAGWGAIDDTPPPQAIEAVAAERQPTPPEPREARDPYGDDLFVDLSGETPVPAGTLANVAGVKFRDAGTIYEFDAGEASYVRGDRVVVESDRGPIVGTIAVSSRRLPVLDPLRRVLRPATAVDEGSRDRNLAKEREAFLFGKEKIRERNLPMKLVRVEYPLAAGKVLFYFASDDRVDFRDLVKDLAAKLHARIEMRQIGARDEAKMVGGIGSCGRELCCSTWLPAFVPVSIKMAKDQGIVLNPSKVSGQCGRLKCCLVYEHDLYKEMRKSLPKVGKRVTTPAGDGKVVELDVLRQRVRVWFDEGGSESFPPDVITVHAPPPQLGKGGKLPVVSDDET